MPSVSLHWSTLWGLCLAEKLDSCCFQSWILYRYKDLHYFLPTWKKVHPRSLGATEVIERKRLLAVWATVRLKSCDWFKAEIATILRDHSQVIKGLKKKRVKCRCTSVLHLSEMIFSCNIYNLYMNEICGWVHLIKPIKIMSGSYFTPKEKLTS